MPETLNSNGKTGIGINLINEDIFDQTYQYEVRISQKPLTFLWCLLGHNSTLSDLEKWNRAWLLDIR